MFNIFFSLALLVVILVAIVVFLKRLPGAKPTDARPLGRTSAPAADSRLGARTDFPETTFEPDDMDPKAVRRAMRRRQAAVAAPAPRKQVAVTDPLARPRSFSPSSREASGQAEAKVVEAATRALLASGIEVPEVGPASEAGFDAHETQVFMRPSSTSAATVPRIREGVAPVTLSGPRLVGLSGSRKGNTFPVLTAGITVGRHPSCDVVIVDPRVSGRHAWIGIVDGKAMLRDLKSTNGTFLNAQAQSSVSETELRSGDTIFFGGHHGDQYRFVAD
jgi:hypothetical protein